MQIVAVVLLVVLFFATTVVMILLGARKKAKLGMFIFGIPTTLLISLSPGVLQSHNDEGKSLMFFIAITLLLIAFNIAHLKKLRRIS